MVATRRGFLAGALGAACATAAPVKITGVETFAVRVPDGGSPDPLRVYRYPVTRVHTDAGITGTSFIGIDPTLLESWVKPALLGQDLFAIDRHMKRLQMNSGESRTQGWSGVEHAMWDCVGRLAGRPVAELLGKAKDRLRIYRTTVFPGKQDQSDVPYERQAEFAKRLQSNGYTAIKIRAWRPRPMDDVDATGVIRAAVGPSFKIMLDRTAVRPGWVWDYPTALQVARGLEKHNAYWLEEPFDGMDLQGPARLAAETDILITGGELGRTLFEFAAFLHNKTYDIVQPDTRICGGIWAAKKISTLAASFGVPCVQHGTGGFALAGYIQAGCAMTNCEWQEMIGAGPNLPTEEWEPGLVLLEDKKAWRVENGYVLLPKAPGLGLRVSEAALKEYRIRA
ncbi:MAG: mandelate racemase/muconate lactonizing enzyme family protein [Acidobacteria bacterium]|nr:mandelate racemase/muconate lactonizing enzyme family protein [Acidobacteriota bacterium]